VNKSHKTVLHVKGKILLYLKKLRKKKKKSKNIFKKKLFFFILIDFKIFSKQLKLLLKMNKIQIYISFKKIISKKINF
jgi:hypothetical protein